MRRGESRSGRRNTLWGALAAELTLKHDGTQARVAVLQQLMLTVVALAVTAFAVIARIPGDLTMFFTGVGMVFVLAVVTMLVPWSRLSPWAVGVIPVLDIVAIMLMRVAFPESGLALLWLFPASCASSLWSRRAALPIR